MKKMINLIKIKKPLENIKENTFKFILWGQYHPGNVVYTEYNE